MFSPEAGQWWAARGPDDGTNQETAWSEPTVCQRKASGTAAFSHPDP